MGGKKVILIVEEPARNVQTSTFYTDRWADWGSASHPGRRGARCVSWPARVRADSRAGSSPSRQSRNGPGSPRGRRCCSRVPPRCPSSNWGRNIRAWNSDFLEMLGLNVAALVMLWFLVFFFLFLQEAHDSCCLSTIFMLHLVELLFLSDACATSCFILWLRARRSSHSIPRTDHTRSCWNICAVFQPTFPH